MTFIRHLRNKNWFITLNTPPAEAMHMCIYIIVNAGALHKLQTRSQNAARAKSERFVTLRCIRVISAISVYDMTIIDIMKAYSPVNLCS